MKKTDKHHMPLSFIMAQETQFSPIFHFTIRFGFLLNHGTKSYCVCDLGYYGKMNEDQILLDYQVFIRLVLQSVCHYPHPIKTVSLVIMFYIYGILNVCCWVALLRQFITEPWTGLKKIQRYFQGHILPYNSLDCF